MASYNDPVKLEDGLKVDFPDFSLEYLGRREVPMKNWKTKQHPEGGTPYIYYDFKISSNDQEQTVSWSFGSGLIVPRPFEFLGSKYTLVKEKGGITVAKVS